MTDSTAFLMEKRFLSPLIGSNLLKSGISGFVVKIKPICINPASNPAIATANAKGITVKTISRRVTKLIWNADSLSIGSPMREL